MSKHLITDDDLCELQDFLKELDDSKADYLYDKLQVSRDATFEKVNTTVPVLYTIEQLANIEDKELDCISCLVQVMKIFQKDLEAEQISRISKWFGEKYNLPINKMLEEYLIKETN